LSSFVADEDQKAARVHVLKEKMQLKYRLALAVISLSSPVSEACVINIEQKLQQVNAKYFMLSLAIGYLCSRFLPLYPRLQ